MQKKNIAPNIKGSALANSQPRFRKLIGLQILNIQSDKTIVRIFK